MNFFGHLTIASFSSRAEGYLLGSMLPDFASMCRQRLRGADSTEVEAGIRFHHLTDRLFHESAIFLEWTRLGSATLLDDGVRRGTAMGVAHVGPELVLDGLLAERFGEQATYLSALEAGAPDRLGASLRWRKEEGASRFELLRRRLIEHGALGDARDDDVLLMRVARTLDRRPRLALRPEDRDAVARWLRSLSSMVEEDADALVDQLRKGLAASGESGAAR